MRLECKYEVQAAHQLSAGVPANHPCRRLHGHRYNITVTIIGDVNPETGMILEYEEIDSRVWEVLRRIDHHFLNYLGLDLDVLGEPVRVDGPGPAPLHHDVIEAALAARVRGNSTVENLVVWLKAELARRFNDVRKVGGLAPQVYAVRIEEDGNHAVEL